jgi:hypothetical protein
MPATRSRSRSAEEAPRAKPRADAYVGLLGISLLALAVAMLFAWLTYSAAPDNAPKVSPVRAAAPGGGQPTGQMGGQPAGQMGGQLPPGGMAGGQPPPPGGMAGGQPPPGGMAGGQPPPGGMAGGQPGGMVGGGAPRPMP